VNGRLCLTKENAPDRAYFFCIYTSIKDGWFGFVMALGRSDACEESLRFLAWATESRRRE
jgi:hypothetical protein